ncbi:hypothetical protein JHS3_02060 [Jeongeupia sp. HS-3]|nr:hypothetical protein JHS3_02060 [Jeongeupia sp. HS-3]
MDAPYLSDDGRSPLPDIGKSIGRITPTDGEKALAQLTEQSLSAGQYGWRSNLLDRTSNGLESLLDRYGKARLDASIGDDGRLGSASADFLLPFDETTQRSRFTQLGIRNDHDRTVTNVGVVQREQNGGWTNGYNAFVDQELGTETTRLGFGTSSNTDYLSVAMNTYLPVGDWRDGETRSERAAPGFDLSAQAYLPSYPQLSGGLKFERYRGDDITLPGSDIAHDNPSAVTASLQYTPFPLLSLGADYRRDDNDEKDWHLQATLSYQFGVPLNQQLRSNSNKPSLTRDRDAFVDRNGVLAWQSREEATPAFSASLAGDVEGAPGQAANVTLSIQSRYPVVSLAWLGDAAPLLNAAGTSPLLGRSGTLAARIRLTLPPSSGQSYSLAARIVDSNGNATVTPSIQIRSLPATS